MGKWAEIVVNSLTSSIITFLVTVGIGLSMMPNGIVYIDDPIKISNNYLVTVGIINYTDKILDDILVELPGKIKGVHINRELEYSIEKYHTSGHGEFIRIKRITEKTNNQLVIEYEPSGERVIQVSNLRNNNLKLIKKTEYLNPFKESIRFAAISGILYAIVMGLTYYFFSIQQEKRKEGYEREIKNVKDILEDRKDEIERVLSDGKELKREQEDLKKKLKDTETRYHKYRLLYVARISEYRKELDFWRDTLRKTINNSEISEKIIKEITASLKTYGTLYSDDDIELDYIKIAGDIVSKDK
jgi:hypothetical protein